MERLLNELDDSLYGTDTEQLCARLKPMYRVVKHNNERLPNIYHRLLRDKQFFTLFVRSPMGSGKTFQLKNIIRNFRRSAATSRKELKVLIVTPKRTFASYVGKQLPDFVDYRSVKKPYCFQKHPRMIVQLQSLKNFREIETDTAYVRGYNLVIMDEIHSIIEELFSDLFSPMEKKRCISIFVKVLRAIPRWVCLDAHLSYDLIQMLKQIDDESEIDKSRICLINTFRRQDYKIVFYRKCLYSKSIVGLLSKKLIASSRFAKYKALLSTQMIGNIVAGFAGDEVDRIYRKIYCRDLEEMSDSNDILVDLYGQLKEGKNVCVTTSTKQQANFLQRLFKKLGFKVDALTGESSEETKKAFAKDPDRFVRRYQLFIYTTAFQVGIDVSSSVAYFDSHFVFIECGVNVATPGAFVQAIGRIRKIRSNEIKVVVIDKEKRTERNKNMSLNDFIPYNDNIVLPSGKHDETMLKDLVDFHFREKSLGKSVTVYLAMFLRLLACKSRAYVSINGSLYQSDEVVNFANFQYSLDEYSKHVDEFINLHAEEIQTHLEKLIKQIWKRLESSSMFVSTLVNNYQAFVSLPPGMSRSECLLKVCEFTSLPFGFLHTFLFCSCEHNRLGRRYFENSLSSYFSRADMNDLNRFRSLLQQFLQCCQMTNSSRLRIDESRMKIFLQRCSSSIVHCYSKFVSSVISRSTDIRTSFAKLLAKCLRVYITKDFVDFGEVSVYKKVINIEKLIEYNIQSDAENTENISDYVHDVQDQ